MKKILLFLALSISVLIVFSSCGHTHTWREADCLSAKTCTVCGETEGSPTAHKWKNATCTTPKKCSTCGKTVSKALGHNWIKASSASPRRCSRCGEMSSLPTPESGQVFIGAELYRASELTIKSSTSDSCYIQLKNSSGYDVFSFFVRAGDNVTVSVPSGYYYVYFSYGKRWYGTEYLFGEETTYSKDRELLDFENYTYEYTLYPTYNGNFTETPIDADEF